MVVSGLRPFGWPSSLTAGNGVLLDWSGLFVKPVVVGQREWRGWENERVGAVDWLSGRVRRTGSTEVRWRGQTIRCEGTVVCYKEG